MATPPARDFLRRRVTVGNAGMAATSHPASTLAAVDILRAGGNAVDAAIAAVAVQCVVEPLSTGLGGDCFALYAPRDGALVALNGSGRTPARSTLQAATAECGPSATIPFHSVHAVTVPGAVDAWCCLSEKYGVKPLAEVLAPAIRYAEEGFCVAPRLSAIWAIFADILRRDSNARKHFLIDDKAPQLGQVMRNVALGSTLRRIAKEGRDGFYAGPVAREMVDLLRARGGQHDLEDFAACRCTFDEPLRIRYRDYEIVECGGNAQGVTALLITKLLAGFDLSSSSYSEADRIHLLAEATKAAYRMRDAYLSDADTRRSDEPPFLSDHIVDAMRSKITLDRASDPVVWDLPEHKDTVCLSVVDRDGNAISFINSLFGPFGSGIYAPESGILFHNRGCGFTLEEGHPNAFAPGKRPLHTLIPGIVMKDGRAVMPFGVMGGQYQAAGHAHVLSRLLDMGLDVQQAADWPRTFAFNGKLTLEPMVDPAVDEDLTRRGHQVVRQPGPLGGCQAIWIDHDRGICLGASDSRKDGLALPA